MPAAVEWSRTVTFFEGEWHEGNVPDHGASHFMQPGSAP